MAFQVAGVSKALGAVSRLTGSMNDVVFRNPSRGGSYTLNVDTCTMLSATGGDFTSVTAVILLNVLLTSLSSIDF